MKNKYYSPFKEDFFYGVEFEFLQPIWEKDTKRKWIKYDWINSHAAPITFRPNGISLGGFSIKEQDMRVKYLDEKDILSLGWEKDGYEYSIGCYFLSGQIQFQNIKIEKESDYIVYDEYSCWRDVLFDGRLLNKSELIRIMNLLNIKHNG